MTNKTPLLFASLLVLAACQAQTEAQKAPSIKQAAISIEAPETPAAAPIEAAEAVKPPATTSPVKTVKAPAPINVPTPKAPQIIKTATLTPPAVKAPVAVKVKTPTPAVIQTAAVALTPTIQPVPAVATRPSLAKPDVTAIIPQVTAPTPTPAPVIVNTPVKTAQVVEQTTEAKAEAMAKPVGPNAAYNDFLAKYVVPRDGINLVRYADVSPSDKANLDGYINRLSESGAPNGSKEEIMAYWFNLYNAKTVSLILDNYPLTSIKKISRPWGKKRLTVAGKSMSLNNIEHDTIRATYDEPRVHYAFNCASIGCPNLKMSAWEAETLEADLTQAAQDFVASPRGMSVDSKGRLTASKIFKWYKKDFGGSEKGILAHTVKYATGEKKAAIENATKINSFDYNWSLNIAK